MTDGIALLQDLIQIPSPNPPGDTVAIATYIAEKMQAIDCDVRLIAPDEKPEALNTIATLGKGDPVVMLHAHIDTVPIASNEAENWTVAPYSGILKDGKIYGKGSIDDKAPLASMMLAMEYASNHLDKLSGTLIFVAAAEEEVGGQLGTKWLAEKGHLPPCDFIIVGEQTANKVAIAHKGVMRATITTIGKSVHATNPDRGINAITAMSKVVLALEDYHRDLSERVHPMVGVPTCNVGVIQGGSTANAVPDQCRIKLDRRMIPREDPEIVKAELQSVLDSVDVSPATSQISHFIFSSWFDSSIDSALSQIFLACVQSELCEHPGPIGYLPGSDAKHLMELARGDMIIFGPGSYEVAHAFDEHVRVEDFKATTQILINFIGESLLKD